MAPEMASILELLMDGKWHSVAELLKQTGLPSDKIRTTLEFLKEYDFVVFDGNGKRVKLEHRAREFLTETTTA